MIKEEVLNLCSSKEEEERVLAVYEAAERFKTEPSFEKLTKKDEVKRLIKEQLENYHKRMAMKARAAERRHKKQNAIKQFAELLLKADAAKVDYDDLIYSAKKVIKDKYNQEVLSQIEELRKKMIE